MVVAGCPVWGAFAFFHVLDGRGCCSAQVLLVRNAFLLMGLQHVWHRERGDALLAMVIGGIPTEPVLAVFNVTH